MASAEGQQHPLKIYYIMWGALFVLSGFSYATDFMDHGHCVRLILLLLFMRSRRHRFHLHAYGLGAARAQAGDSGAAGRYHGADLADVLRGLLRRRYPARELRRKYLRATGRATPRGPQRRVAAAARSAKVRAWAERSSQFSIRSALAPRPMPIALVTSAPTPSATSPTACRIRHRSPEIAQPRATRPVSCRPRQHGSFRRGRGCERRSHRCLRLRGGALERQGHAKRSLGDCRCAGAVRLGLLHGKKTDTFPPELLARLIDRAGLPGVIGNCHASGTTNHCRTRR